MKKGCICTFLLILKILSLFLGLFSGSKSYREIFLVFESWLVQYRSRDGFESAQCCSHKGWPIKKIQSPGVFLFVNEFLSKKGGKPSDTVPFNSIRLFTFTLCFLGRYRCEVSSEAPMFSTKEQLHSMIKQQPNP